MPKLSAFECEMYARQEELIAKAAEVVGDEETAITAAIHAMQYRELARWKRAELNSIRAENAAQSSIAMRRRIERAGLPEGIGK